MVVNAINELDFFFRLTKEEKTVAYGYVRRIGWQTARPTTVAITIIKLVRPQMKFKDIRKFCNVNAQTLRPWLVKFCIRLHLNEVDTVRILELDPRLNTNKPK